MKKLFYRWSFAKLFSLAACVALGSLLAQQAVAQDFGWEPFPPSFWEGGWDANLKCTALDGTTTITRNPMSPGTDSVVQDGKVSCTFTDPANNNFNETFECSLHIQIDKLSESCVNNFTNPPTSTLTVTGTCPVATVPVGQGTIDCTGAPFCLYAGDDPNGNTSGECVWNLGWGALKGKKVVPLTQTQCQTAFGSLPVFSFSQTLEGTVCALNAQSKDLGSTVSNFCHSDTWDPAQAAFCDFPKGAVKNTAIGVVENFLTADTEYSPTTINADCRPNKDQGDITLIVLGNNSDAGTNSIDVQAINQSSITVNPSSIPNFPVFKPNSCDFQNPDTLRCRVPSCLNGHSIVENTIIPGTKTATLTMDAFTNDGTHVVGDVETRKVSQ